VTFLLYIADGIFLVLGAGVLLGSVRYERVRWLLPAAAYGVSGAISFALESWWPLFLGLSLVLRFAAMEVDADPQPGQRLSPIGMFVNHGLHIWAGIVGSEIFLLSVDGLFFVALLAVVVQGLDTVALYHTYTRLLADSPAEVRSQLPVKVAWLFGLKVVWYGLITLLTAAAARHLV